MPVRVRQQIERRQAVSERLISWVQFALIVLFGSLWLAAQQVNMTDTPFQVVPLALAAYFVFTVTRLILSYRIALPHWFLTISVLMDVALLMLLIDDVSRGVFTTAVPLGILTSIMGTPFFFYLLMKGKRSW